MQLIKIDPADVTALAGSCRKIAVEAAERAQEDDRLICLQAQRNETGLKLAFAVSVFRKQAEIINKDGVLYWEPSEYLECLRGNDHDHWNKKAI